MKRADFGRRLSTVDTGLCVAWWVSLSCLNQCSGHVCGQPAALNSISRVTSVLVESAALTALLISSNTCGTDGWHDMRLSVQFHDCVHRLESTIFAFDRLTYTAHPHSLRQSHPPISCHSHGNRQLHVSHHPHLCRHPPPHPIFIPDLKPIFSTSLFHHRKLLPTGMPFVVSLTCFWFPLLVGFCFRSCIRYFKSYFWLRAVN